MRVLLLKSPPDSGFGRDDPYVQIFTEAGYCVSPIPPLEFVTTNLDKLAEDLKLGHHGSLILTSPRSIRAVAKVVAQDPGSFQHWDTEQKTIYVVGEKSGADVRQLIPSWPRTLIRGQESGDARSLADLILSERLNRKEENDDDKDTKAEKRFLFPCGNLAQDALAQALARSGMEVTSLIVYETRPHPELKASLESAMMPTILRDSEGQEEEEQPKLAMVFFSPSGVEFTFEALSDLDLSDQFKESGQCGLVDLYALGPSTEKVILERRWPLKGVARKPRPEEVLALFDVESTRVNQ